MTSISTAYLPTSRYILASLNLHQARLKELRWCLKFVTDVEKYDLWFQKILTAERTAMFRFKLDPEGKTTKVTNKMLKLDIKIAKIGQLLEKRFAVSLSTRAIQYGCAIQKHIDQDLYCSSKHVSAAFEYFREELSEFENHNSTTISDKIVEAQAEIEKAFNNILHRILEFTKKTKNLPPKIPTIPIGVSLVPTMHAPKYRPSADYCWARLAYRQARLDELNIYMEHQTDPSFDGSEILEKEHKRIVALETFAKRCQVDMGEGIPNCKASLLKMQPQKLEDTSPRETIIIPLKPNSPSSSFSLSSFFLAPTVICERL